MRIYVAGKYSAPTTIDVLNNIHDGIKASVEIIRQGHSVFCPWLDHQFHFFDKTITKEEYQRNSMAWVEVADEVWVLPNSENSGGTQREIARAKELGIPVKFL